MKKGLIISILVLVFLTSSKASYAEVIDNGGGWYTYHCQAGSVMVFRYDPELNGGDNSCSEPEGFDFYLDSQASGTYHFCEKTTSNWPLSYANCLTDPDFVSNTPVVWVNPNDTAGYTMQEDVKNSFTDLLVSFVTGALQIIIIAVLIIGGYWVSVRLVNVLLRWFKRFN
jgi:hypothetical protein